MPDDPRRLYGLSSTYTDYRLTGEAGPSLPIDDPVLAMRWYFTHEREEGLAVEGQVSDDNGVTWRLLPVPELFADAERALPSAQHPALLRDALADDAADWLDAWIRFVAPDDPTQWCPGVPGLDAWRRGGEIWALAMNAVPNEALITRLADQYTNPLPEGEGVDVPEDSESHREGPDALREGAREMLAALVLAEAPGTAAVHDLLAAFRPVEMLSYASAIGQLRDRVDQAQERLLNHLVTRVPETAEAVAAHPDPGHPVQWAARIFLRRLAHAGDGSGRGQELLARARQALDDAAATPEATPPADDAAATETETPALPGFPRQLTDLHAAAAWRTMSPLARQDAERAMADLVRAEDWLVQAAAEADSWVDGRPRDPERARAFDRLSPGWQRLEARHARNGEVDARENSTYFRQWLQELDARHALLMHATVLADAQAAAITAKQKTVIAASALAQASAETAPPRTVGEVWAQQEGSVAQVTAAEERIDQTLEVQRQTTRDALQRLFSQSGGSMGMYRLRTLLTDKSRLSPDDDTRAYEAIAAAARTLNDLERRLKSGYVEFEHAPVTQEDVARAREGLQHTEQFYEGLRSSRSVTLRALKALDSVADLSPTQDGGVLGRAAQIAADSRKRTAPARAAQETGRRRADPAAQRMQHE